jgi:hypothetical protein
MFSILHKFLPISLELGWFCTLAQKSKPPDFLQKLFLDPQHVISSLNSREKGGLRTAWPRAGVFMHRHFMRVSNRA